jgi:hypothetical protein
MNRSRRRAQVVLAQQAAGIGREAGKEKVFDERQVAGAAKAAHESGNPGLGAQVVEVDPARGRRQVRHRSTKASGIRQAKVSRTTGAGITGVHRVIPAAQLDSLQPLARQLGIDDRAEQPEAVEIIDPQANAQPVLAGELPGEPPADPDVAEIVDHPAEDVPVGAGARAGTGGVGRRDNIEARYPTSADGCRER